MGRSVVWATLPALDLVGSVVTLALAAAGRAQGSSPGSQLPEAKAEGAARAARLARALPGRGANAQLLLETPRAGGGTREGLRQTQAPDHLCPARGGDQGGLRSHRTA